MTDRRTTQHKLSMNLSAPPPFQLNTCEIHQLLESQKTLNGQLWKASEKSSYFRTRMMLGDPIKLQSFAPPSKQTPQHCWFSLTESVSTLSAVPWGFVSGKRLKDRG